MFNATDYAANPRKYELFKTARLNTHVFTENGEHLAFLSDVDWWQIAEHLIGMEEDVDA